jgi:hypothetical protein
MPPAPTIAARLRNVVAFVAIVWGVAATFVAFEVVSLSGMDLALSYPAVFGNLALSRDVTQSTSCLVAPNEQRGASSESGDVRVGAWALGLGVGRDAVLRQFASSNRTENQATAMTALAARLGVPRPGAFRPQEVANANTEFVAFVELDAGGTAHRLAVAFSPQVCEVFKLGALWGYSEIVRPALAGERAVFAMEIRYHAQRAGVPEALWSPMLQRTAKGAKPEDVSAQMAALTKGMTSFLGPK